MKLLSSLLIVLLTPTICFARVQVHKTHDEKDNIGKPLDYHYVAQYRGQKDRYNEAAFRNDPEVLVSSKRSKLPLPTITVISEPVIQPTVNTEPIISISYERTQPTEVWDYCNDKGECNWRNAHLR